MILLCVTLLLFTCVPTNDNKNGSGNRNQKIQRNPGLIINILQQVMIRRRREMSLEWDPELSCMEYERLNWWWLLLLFPSCLLLSEHRQEPTWMIQRLNIRWFLGRVSQNLKSVLCFYHSFQVLWMVLVVRVRRIEREKTRGRSKIRITTHSYSWEEETRGAWEG